MNPDCRNPDMRRAYIRLVDRSDGKQKRVPIGWWCPVCRFFENDLPEE
ncbi:hypothetical protein [Methanoplanus endosymbiosus]|uniref:Uncharacterized protein n=1 Tax=Methanoplanus endosymbiosus TaxID=33865 RepID=A0A9E7TJJ8_9EURY|nr:hypothetical protein [Methanoplanus endosymbiosus]UUX93733.1 hypothetical protein L6E24_06360 [Methanoplanus endosymbiosus]